MREREETLLVTRVSFRRLCNIQWANATPLRRPTRLNGRRPQGYKIQYRSNLTVAAAERIKYNIHAQ